MTISAHCNVALCRAGFEPECVQDLLALADAAALTSLAAPKALPGLVALSLAKACAPAKMSDALARRPPIFAREVSFGSGPCPLGERDRVTPIVAAAAKSGVRCGALWLEYPDTNDGKQLSSLCRRLDPLLRNALAASGQLTRVPAPRLPRLHVLFTSKREAYVGTSASSWNSNWPMGIPRLRMPRDVPSRSTLKLAEAFNTFLTED